MLADQDQAAALLEDLTLDSLLKANAASRGYDIALRDPPGRREWSDVGPVSLSFLELDARAEKLAGLLSLNHAPPGATVAILAPLGPEAVVAILGCLRAGLAPLLLPPATPEPELLAIMEGANAIMALGISRLAEARPLLTLRRIAVRSFATRFVGGFGSEVPDGVAPLDQLMAGATPAPGPGRLRPALRVVDQRRPEAAVALTEKALLGAALQMSRLLKPKNSARIVTAMVGGDLASLASGPGIALLTGVELLTLGLFRLGELQACLDGGRDIHLVLPAAAEPALALSKHAAHPAIASLVFIRRDAEPALPAIDRPDIAIIDVAVNGPAEIAATRRTG